MSNIRLATLSVVLDCNCMPTYQVATDILLVRGGRGGVRDACPILYLQLQVLRLTANACLLPAATGLAFLVGEGKGLVACPIVGLQLQVSPSSAIACLHTRLQLHAHTPGCNWHLFCKWASEERGTSCMFDSRLAIASVALD